MPLAMACVGGPQPALKALEKDLAASLKRCGLDSIKWSRLRTRVNHFECARQWLELMQDAARQKVFAADVVLDFKESPATPQRWTRLYQKALRYQLGRWPAADWDFWPDRRTGIDWQAMRLDSNRRLKKTFKARRIVIRQVKAQKAELKPLVQAADLLAGLARLKYGKGPGHEIGDPGSRAELNRRDLLKPVFLTTHNGPFKVHRAQRIR